MGEHNRSKPTDAVTQIEVAAPPEVERTPPAFANYVTVAGSVDCITIDFHYVPSPRFRDALDGKGEGIDRRGERAIIRSVPVARVAIPLTTVADLLTSVMDVAIDGAHDLATRGGQFVDDMKQLGERFAAMGTKFQNMGKK